MRELKLKECQNCKALIKVIDDCHCACNFICCDEVMSDVIPNSVVASAEKHIPEYVRENDEIKVKVNHVMEDDHYIKWLCFVTSEKEEYVYFEPGMKAEASFSYQKGIIYAYCNNHGLWQKEVL